MDSFWNHIDPMLSHQQRCQLVGRYPAWDQTSTGDCQSRLGRCPVLTTPILRIILKDWRVWACSSSLDFSSRRWQLWSKSGCSTWKIFTHKDNILRNKRTLIFLLHFNLFSFLIMTKSPCTFTEIKLYRSFVWPEWCIRTRLFWTAFCLFLVFRYG